MYTLKQGEEHFGEDENEEIQDILLDNDWLDMTEKDKDQVKLELEGILGDKLPQPKKKEIEKNRCWLRINDDPENPEGIFEKKLVAEISTSLISQYLTEVKHFETLKFK